MASYVMRGNTNTGGVSVNSKFKDIIYITILLLFNALPTGAADIRITTDVEELSIEELLNVEVTVASKSQQSVGDAPSSVTVFTREEMKNMGIRTVEELLNYIPGFVTSRETSEFRKEHIKARGGRFYDIMFQYNGQRINSLYQGSYSDGNQQIPIDNLKQVEVIRGPGSALYGSNAFLGVVNIVPDDRLNNFSLALGDADRREASINFSTQTDDLSVVAFVQGFSDSGLEYVLTDQWGRTAETRDPENGLNALVTLKYKNWSFMLRHNEARIEDFIMFGSLGNRINNGKSRQSLLNLAYRLRASSKINIDFSTGYVYDNWNAVFTQLPIGIIPVAFNEQGVPTQFNQQVLAGGPNLESYNANLNIDASFQVSRFNHLIAGVSLSHGKLTRVDNQGFWNYEIGNDFEYFEVMKPNTPGKEFNELETRNVLSVYLQDEHKLGKSFKLTAGFRFDSYNDFGSAFNPRLALIYSTPFNSKIKLMYGSAFRAPNFSELYDKNNPSFVGNPELGAEKVTTLEAAYIQEFKNFQCAITFFQSDMTELIEAKKRIDPNDPSSPFIYENLGEQTTRGLEFELKVMPVAHFMFYGSLLHFLDVDNLTIPKTTGSFGINFHYQYFNVNINGLFRGDSDLVSHQGAYIILNAKLSIDVTDKIKLSGVIRNLADTTYYTHSILSPVGVQNRGRTFTIGIEWSGK